MQITGPPLAANRMPAESAQNGRGSAQTGKSDVAALQTMLAGYAARDLTAAERPLPGAEAPQAALPQEALLHRVEGRERPLLSRGTDDGRFARGGMNCTAWPFPTRTITGRDAPPQSETETWVAQQAAEIAIPERPSPLKCRQGKHRRLLKPDFTGQDSTPRAKGQLSTRLIRRQKRRRFLRSRCSIGKLRQIRKNRISGRDSRRQSRGKRVSR